METSASTELDSARDQTEGFAGLEIAGKYRLGHCLGDCGREAIYETVWQDRPAIFKLIRPDVAETPWLLARFATGKRLRHPNLLAIYDFGELAATKPAHDKAACGNDSFVYAVMERGDENLGGVLRERALNNEETKQILDGILPALAFLHEHGYVHASVRPADIFACGDNVKLSSDCLLPVSARDGIRRNPGVYEAPETAAGIFEPSCDSWSVAAVTLECLTRSPYRSGMDQVAPPFLEIVQGGLQQNPKARWSVEKMAAVLDGPPQRGTKDAAIRAVLPNYRRFGGIAIGGMLAAAAVCAFLVRSAHQAPAPAPITIQAPAPVAVTIPAPVLAKAALSVVPAGWAVVGAASRNQGDAEKRASEIRKRHPKLNPRVFAGNVGGDRYFVLLGSGYGEAAAKRQLERVRRAGASRDAYVARFPVAHSPSQGSLPRPLPRQP